MPLISKKLAEELAEKDFRDAYVRSQTNAHIVQQLRALRHQRGQTQGDLASEIGTSQSVIARYENPEYEGWGVPTLLDVAAAHDVALLVAFVPHAEFLARTASMAPHNLEVESFSPDAVERLTREQPAVGATTAMFGLSIGHIDLGPRPAQAPQMRTMPQIGGFLSSPSTLMTPGKQDEREQLGDYHSSTTPLGTVRAI